MGNINPGGGGGGAPSGPAGGTLSGSYPNPGIATPFGVGQGIPVAEVDILAPAGTVAINVAGTAPAPTSSGNGAAAPNIATVVGQAGQATSFASSTSKGGTGGPISITAGAGGVNSDISNGLNVNTHRGGIGGAVSLAAGDGGNATGATGLVSGGGGGNLTLTSGVGGTSLAGRGALGGSTTVSSGAGGQTAAALLSGNGGQLQIQGGAGGDNAVSGGSAGGGGAVTIDAGHPGVASNGAFAGNPGVIAIGSGSGSASAVNIGNSGAPLALNGSTVKINGLAPGVYLLEEHTASASASLDFTSSISAAFDEYAIEVLQIVPATNAQSIAILYSTDGGSTYDNGSNYAWVGWRNNNAGSAAAGSETATSLDLAAADTVTNTAAKGGLSATLKLVNTAPGTAGPNLLGTATYSNGAGQVLVNFGSRYTVVTAVNAFRVLAGVGNLASGTVRCYGIVK